MEYLVELMQDINCVASTISNDAIAQKDWMGYFEIHIEQGPVLYQRNEPLAIVTAIAGQMRIWVVFEGVAGHAGTVPMDMRKDALAAASAAVLAIEKFGLENKEAIVATVGKLEIVHAATNVIPGKVGMSIDLRSADSEILQSSAKRLQHLVETIAGERAIPMKWVVVQQSEPVICDDKLEGLLETAMTSAGYKPIKLVSGAGHDALLIASVAPVIMLFVKCFEGISHNPLENVEIKDIAAALQVGENFCRLLAMEFSEEKK